MTNPTNENYLGSALSGIDGATGRILTLANTSLTVSNGLEVFVNGVFQTITTNFTVSHLTSSSTITFVGAINNTDRITIIYFTADVITGTFKYTTAANVYAKTGLSATEVNFTIGSNANIINDAETELEVLTGRKFTNANAITEFIDGPQPDTIGYTGNKATSIRTSFYPIQSITGFEQDDVNGNAISTYATLTSVQIAAGTFSTTDYWLETQQDPLNNNIIANGNVRLKVSTFNAGYQNIKISYTYGYSSVPYEVTALASCLAGIRAWVYFLGGNYNRLDSYAIPQQNVNKGDFYARGQSMIAQLTEEANRLLDRVGRRPRILFIASSGAR